MIFEAECLQTKSPYVSVYFYIRTFERLTQEQNRTKNSLHDYMKIFGRMFHVQLLSQESNFHS